MHRVKLLSTCQERISRAIALIAIMTLTIAMQPIDLLQEVDAEGVSIDLGLTDGVSNPKIVSIGDIAYVVWAESSADIFIATSTDEAESFDPDSVINISNNEATSGSPDAAISLGGTVYVVWEDGNEDFTSDVFVATSDDFSSPIQLSTTGTAHNPAVAVSNAGEVYFVWEDTSEGNGDIFFSSTTNGLSPINISNTPEASFNPVIAISPDDSTIYVAWEDESTDDGNIDIFFASAADFDFTFTTTYTSDDPDQSADPEIAVSPTTGIIHLVWQDDGSNILLASSDDAGSTFGSTMEISNTGNAAEPVVIVSSTTDVLYVAWQDDDDIFLSFSTDSGESFSEAIDISEDEETSMQPALALSDEDQPHVVWHSGDDIFVSANTDVLIESITITTITNDEPPWDVEISVFGTVVDAVTGDTVTVEWGDGSSDTGIAIDSITDEWEASHTYDSSAIGEQEIVAKLVSSADEEKASDSETIEVQKHLTTLLLYPIASVLEGEDITATGILIDDDASTEIEGATITFDGAGAGNLVDAVTDVDGLFSSTGQSPNSAPEGWAVQAHFAEDALYFGADSDIETYDTVALDALVFPVTAASQVADLTDFGGSIDFDGAVINDGNVFVSDCSATGEPTSERFVALEDTCLWISPGVELEDGFTASVEMPFNVIDLPEGSIDMFHEEQSEDTIVDVTHERDLDGQIITGMTGSFGRFILGIAQYDEASEGVQRQEVLVGDGNVVTLRDVNDLSDEEIDITLDDEDYKISNTAIISIIDPNGNVDPIQADIVSASIVSETSDPQGIVVVLTETGADTGEFEGEFTFSISESSGTELQARVGDDITVYYISGARFTATIDVVEAGLAELSDTIVLSSSLFTQVSGAVNLEFVEAQLGSNGLVTVTMSYANAPLYGDTPDSLRLWYRDPGTEGWTEVTLRDDDDNITGIDTDAQTVTGEASGLGVFVIGKDPGGVGGSGGGLAKPGTGIVLDSVASITSSLSGGGSSSSSSSSSASPPPSSSNEEVDEGSDVQIEVDATGEGKISVNFDMVMSAGDLEVEEKTVSELADLFDSTTSTTGSVSIGGSDYTTAGSIFEIDASDIDFSGTVQVTIPYDESMVGSSESDVRFLHYTGDEWEDATISIDTDLDTVTGEVSSLSPVVAAIVDDGTFGAAYFELNPLTKIGVSDVNLLTPYNDAISSDVTTGTQLTISTSIKNAQKKDQTYTLIIQVIDSNDVTRSLSWQIGSLELGQDVEISQVWTAEEPGIYKIQIFVWDKIGGNPIPLSTVKVLTAKVN